MRKIFLFVLPLFILGCKTKTTVEPAVEQTTFSNVVILGNSITYHPAEAAIGWTGNWGMAASAPEKDYVHLLTAKFLAANSQCKLQAYNISEFEQGYKTYDFNANLKPYHDSKPDLLILRIGENVQPNFDSVAFAKKYQDLIAYMKVDNSKLKVLSVGSFWDQRDYINVIMSRYTPYISLQKLGGDSSNCAFNLINVADGVKAHPGDKGMQGIADLIWAKVITLK